MVDFLSEVAPADGVLTRVLAEFKARDEGFGDSYVLHDELETFNAPCYFYEMVARAGAHGLAFLAEARPETMFPSNQGPKVAEHLLEKCGGVQVLVEQYLDFAVNRMFRESLFVHAQRATQIRYDLDANRWCRMHFAAWTPPVDGPTRLDHSRQEYEVADGATLFTNDPGLKATLGTAQRAVAVDAVTIRTGRGRSTATCSHCSTAPATAMPWSRGSLLPCARRRPSSPTVNRFLATPSWKSRYPSSSTLRPNALRS